jgi:nicotinamidase/pyrazinamidase
MRHPTSGETIPTELAELLRDAGVERIVVAGLALDYCVKATSLDGVSLGFSVSTPLTLTAAVNLQPEDGERAVREMSAAGVKVD